jgi:integrase/recombinase XerD
LVHARQGRQDAVQTSDSPSQSFPEQTRYPARNTAIFLLSVKAGLRAKEIASLTWDMPTDAEGNLGKALHLRNSASKGKSGRVIPLNKDLRDALQELHRQRGTSPYVIARAARLAAAAYDDAA